MPRSIVQELQDTVELREKILKLWHNFEEGNLSAAEARVHIGFARAVLESLKVEIAAAHIGPGAIAALGVNRRAPLQLARKRN